MTAVKSQIEGYRDASGRRLGLSFGAVRKIMLTSRRVLVLGDDTRSFLATVRSLGRAGIEVHAAPFNFCAPALASRYIAKIHRLPYYLGDGRNWVEAVEALLARETFDLLIPCDERTLLPIDRHRERLSALSCLAIPDARGMEVFYDKITTRELAQTLGIPVAAGRRLQPGDNAKDLIAEVGLPLAIKPSSSYTIENLYARNKVEIVSDQAVLAQALREPASTPRFCEAYFPGHGIGVSILATQGQILQAFEHHRVHELQGSSYYRVSRELTAALADAAAAMMREVTYTGIAMFEFRMDRASGRWVLLEVNARPWGSLPLPVAVGADFPYRLYQLLVEGVETPPLPYRTGIYGRNLIPDGRYVASRIRQLRAEPSALAAFLLTSAKEYARVLAKREVYDVLVADDPKPGWKEISSRLRDVGGYLASKLPGGEDRAAAHDQGLLRSAVGKVGARGLSLAFVCQGNVCRSPLAEELLRRELDGMKVTVTSYGNLPRAGARSPANAIAAAKTHRVDLECHRSEHFCQNAAEQADVIIVFDEVNRRWIGERYPGLRTPVVMLGSFAPERIQNRAIADPDGGTRAKFDAVYGQIASAISGLSREIREAVRG